LLPGKLSADVDSTIRTAQRHHGRVLPNDVVEHLVRAYGSRYERVMTLADTVEGGDQRMTPEAPVIFAQLVYGAHEEQARTPEDLLWRRTELGARGLITEHAMTKARHALRLPLVGA
jgi:glycerol-3-phosphate dehydrogenase